MSGLKKQVLSNAIDILLNQGNLPEKLDGKKLYGEALEGDDALKADCRVYQLSNETGNGQITVYQVFNGIELYYNDIHLAYCNQDQVTAKNIIEIKHCYIGRYEGSFGENSCCYLSAGDLSIGPAMKKKSFSIFPCDHRVREICFRICAEMPNPDDWIYRSIKQHFRPADPGCNDYSFQTQRTDFL